MIYRLVKLTLVYFTNNCFVWFFGWNWQSGSGEEKKKREQFTGNQTTDNRQLEGDPKVLVLRQKPRSRLFELRENVLNFDLFKQTWG